MYAISGKHNKILPALSVTLMLDPGVCKVLTQGRRHLLKGVTKEDTIGWIKGFSQLSRCDMSSINSECLIVTIRVPVFIHLWISHIINYILRPGPSLLLFVIAHYPT